MLRTKIQPTCRHSTIIVATHQDLPVKFRTFYHHWCCALSFCLQFSNINWCYNSRSSLENTLDTLDAPGTQVGWSPKVTPREQPNFAPLGSFESIGPRAQGPFFHIQNDGKCWVPKGMSRYNGAAGEEREGMRRQRGCGVRRECVVRMASGGNAASEGNVASRNVSSECGVRGMRRHGIREYASKYVVSVRP